jgi:hypothetical protein
MTKIAHEKLISMENFGGSIKCNLALTYSMLLAKSQSAQDQDFSTLQLLFNMRETKWERGKGSRREGEKIKGG